MLLGETLDSMRVYDIIRGAQSVRNLASLGRFKLKVKAQGTMAVNALYASLFHKSIDSLELTHLPKSHREGPDYLNVSLIWHLPQALAVSLQTHDITLNKPSDGVADLALSVQKKLRWKPVLSIHP